MFDDSLLNDHEDIISNKLFHDDYQPVHLGIPLIDNEIQTDSVIYNQLISSNNLQFIVSTNKLYNNIIHNSPNRPIQINISSKRELNTTQSQHIHPQ